MGQHNNVEFGCDLSGSFLHSRFSFNNSAKMGVSNSVFSECSP